MRTTFLVELSKNDIIFIISNFLRFVKPLAVSLPGLIRQSRNTTNVSGSPGLRFTPPEDDKKEVFCYYQDMILYIDTTNAEKAMVALSDKGELVAKKEFLAKYKQSEKLLPTINKLLQSVDGSKPRATSTKIGRGKVQRTVDLSLVIDGIVVVNGPGPFTATRIGVATANALAYGMSKSKVHPARRFGGLGSKVPPSRRAGIVVGINKDKFKDLDELIKKGSDLVKKSKQKIVEPFYDKEPNITVSKKFAK